jgi:Ca-activated chloride channel family protein
MFDLINLQHFHFIRPYWFIVFFVMWWILKAFAKRDDNLALWRNIMSKEILQNLTVSGNSQKWLSPQKLSFVLAIPVCLVLMGPTWQQQPSPFSENNAGLIIALDLSETMAQNDVQPSRLLRAKQKILELLALRGDTHTALLAFAGSAHVVMPMTTDTEMIRHFLASLDQKLMPIKGKQAEKTLPLAKFLLDTTHVPGTILLLTDGATQKTVTAFNHFFKNNQHQLIVWAIGAKPEQINQENSKASLKVNIALQLNQLENLSTESHGRLVIMSHDKQDVEQVNRYIEHNLVIVDDDSHPWHDASYPLVFIIALLFLFWFRKGWTLQW